MSIWWSSGKNDVCEEKEIQAKWVEKLQVGGSVVYSGEK